MKNDPNTRLWVAILVVLAVIALELGVIISRPPAASGVQAVRIVEIDGTTTIGVRGIVSVQGGVEVHPPGPS